MDIAASNKSVPVNVKTYLSKQDNDLHRGAPCDPAVQQEARTQETEGIGQICKKTTRKARRKADAPLRAHPAKTHGNRGWLRAGRWPSLVLRSVRFTAMTTEALKRETTFRTKCLRASGLSQGLSLPVQCERLRLCRATGQLDLRPRDSLGGHRGPGARAVGLSV